MKITIRNITYPSPTDASIALGVQRGSILAARRAGKLDVVGLRRKLVGSSKLKIQTYCSKKDAEYILEHIMDRKNWSVHVRDNLQTHLERTWQMKLT